MKLPAAPTEPMKPSLPIRCAAQTAGGWSGPQCRVEASSFVYFRSPLRADPPCPRPTTLPGKPHRPAPAHVRYAIQSLRLTRWPAPLASAGRSLRVLPSHHVSPPSYVIPPSHGSTQQAIRRGRMGRLGAQSTTGDKTVRQTSCPTSAPPIIRARTDTVVTVPYSSRLSSSKTNQPRDPRGGSSPRNSKTGSRGFSRTRRAPGAAPHTTITSRQPRSDKTKQCRRGVAAATHDA
jgi:hypothetical protein